MKKKLIIFGCFAILLAMGIQQHLQHRAFMKPVEIENIPVTFQPIETRHFYNALTDSERRIYYAAVGMLEQYASGEIVLYYPITARSYYRIETALRYDSERHWHLALLWPFDNNFELVSPPSEQRNPEAIIYRLLLIVDTEVFRREVSVAPEPLPEDWEESLEELYRDVLADMVHFSEITDISFYDVINEQLENIIEKIINNMPEDLNQEEAILYFMQWMVDNMVYDSVMDRIFSSGGSFFDDINRHLDSSSILSLIEGEGVCAGFSTVLNTLARRVGIDTYMVIGTVPGGRHTWNVVKIGDGIFYIEPTSDIQRQRVRPLMTREQFYVIHSTHRPFSDLFEYLWVR